MSENRWVYVITGGAGGMGEAVARRLGQKGTILLTDIDSSRLDHIAAMLRSEGLQIVTQSGDITDRSSVMSLAQCASSHGKLAGLVHTAGISVTMAKWERIFEVDLIGTALLLEAFLPLAEQGSVAVCVASMAGHYQLGNPALEAVLAEPLKKDFLEHIKPFLKDGTGREAYGIAKRGVILLCQMLSPAWGERGARIVSVSPGIIDTPMSRQEFESQPFMKFLVERTPLKRIGKPDEIAAAVEFLLSANASFITGTDLLVDGGVVPQIMPFVKAAHEGV